MSVVTEYVSKVWNDGSFEISNIAGNEKIICCSPKSRLALNLKNCLGLEDDNVFAVEVRRVESEYEQYEMIHELSIDGITAYEAQGNEDYLVWWAVQKMPSEVYYVIEHYTEYEGSTYLHKSRGCTANIDEAKHFTQSSSAYAALNKIKEKFHNSYWHVQCIRCL